MMISTIANSKINTNTPIVTGAQNDNQYQKLNTNTINTPIVTLKWLPGPMVTPNSTPIVMLKMFTSINGYTKINTNTPIVTLKMMISTNGNTQINTNTEVSKSLISYTAKLSGIPYPTQ